MGVAYFCLTDGQCARIQPWCRPLLVGAVVLFGMPPGGRGHHLLVPVRDRLAGCACRVRSVADFLSHSLVGFISTFVVMCPILTLKVRRCRAKRGSPGVKRGSGVVRFEIGDRGQGPSWWLFDNDVLLASPDRYYSSVAFAEREAAAFRAGAAAGVTIEVFPCPGGWRWRAVQPVNYYAASSARIFPRPAQARRAGRDVRRKVRHAESIQANR